MGAPNLRLSQTGYGEKAKNDLRTRTSKQAWVNDQLYVPFNESVHENHSKIYHMYNYLDTSSMKNIPAVNNISDEFILTKINRRIELATTLAIIGPFVCPQFLQFRPSK